MKTFSMLFGFLFFVFFIGASFDNVGALTSVSVDTEIELDVEPIITVSFSTRAAILKATMKPGQLDEIKVGAEIRTNSRTGYKAYLSTDKRRKSATDVKATGLVHINNNTDYIPTLESSVTADNFPVNHWGYSVDGGENYSGMRASNDVDLADFTTSNSSDQRNMDLYFATKIDSGQAGGFYENTIIVTAVANYVAQTINDIQYMQDINNDVALSMVEDQQYQLMDKRDGKKYWISRLRDGNIWMTQNLDYYTIENGGLKLTTELSDVWSDMNYPATLNNRSNDDYYAGSTNLVHYVNRRFAIGYGGVYTVTPEQIAENEELAHYLLGTKYGYQILRFDPLYNQNFNDPGHNSEPDVIESEFDEYVLNHPQSVCPYGWRYPRYAELSHLPSYYGLYDYEAGWDDTWRATTESFHSAVYPILSSLDSRYYFSLAADNSSKSGYNLSSIYYSNSTSTINQNNNSTTVRYFFASSGDSSAFVRCVMRW